MQSSKEMPANGLEPVKTKDIFFYLWPAGFEEDPMFNPNDKKRGEHPYFVRCGHCGRQTSTSTKTAYGNAVVHAGRHYKGGIAELEQLVRDKKKAAGKSKKQKTIIQGFNNNASAQDMALHQWMQLVCVHDISITKMEDKDFSDMLICKSMSYHVFINTMFELYLIVEEKVAAELNGKKGVIIHDGWSKSSRHYVCLLAAYLIATGKRDSSGEMIMEAVSTLLTCKTLPKQDDSTGKTLSLAKAYNHQPTCDEQ